MIGLLVAIILFNFIAFTYTNRFTKNQIIHIWLFTIALQIGFDVMIEFRYEAYWYFNKEPDWRGLLAHTILIPPVNMIFLNWFPFKKKYSKKLLYILFWTIGILLYERITLLPEPWGYFNYGWWRLWHAAMLDPFLFLILVCFYKWIVKAEKELI